MVNRPPLASIAARAVSLAAWAVTVSVRRSVPVPSSLTGSPARATPALAKSSRSMVAPQPRFTGDRDQEVHLLQHAAHRRRVRQLARLVQLAEAQGADRRLHVL